jgi:hypothetical protein
MMADKQFIGSEYDRCINVLECSGVTVFLPESKRTGVIGADGIRYPMPSKEKVVELFVNNQELISRKIHQGFDRLQLTPLAMPLLRLTDLMKETIIRHAEEGKIFQTRTSVSSPLVPVRVNKEKQVWIWETLRQSLETDELIYFPQEYSSSNNKGQTRLEVVNNGSICAVPGWSAGLIENLSVMPAEGQGKTLGGRKQLETGQSPCEYLQILKEEAYQGETGFLIEDFIIKFLSRLVTTNEISNDADDNNALWCLGQYLKIPYADVVPTGRWVRGAGRVRLDMHRSGNKQCTKSWGASTIVRLN